MDIDQFLNQDFDYEAIAKKSNEAQEADTKEAATLDSDGDCDGCKI